MQRDQAHRTNELLERIAIALEKNNKVSNELVNATTKDIPGFEGVLNDLDNLYQPTSDNPDPMYNNLNEYVDTTNGKIKNDSDHDIRSTAAYYEDAIESVRHRDLKTKKDAILDYVTNEFKSRGARYTDIIKFAYYLGASNAPKYDNSCRGYYAMAFNTRYGGHLIQGGKDFLVKGINKEGKERYFAHSSVDSFTDYYKTIE